MPKKPFSKPKQQQAKRLVDLLKKRRTEIKPIERKLNLFKISCNTFALRLQQFAQANRKLYPNEVKYVENQIDVLMKHLTEVVTLKTETRNARISHKCNNYLTAPVLLVSGLIDANHLSGEKPEQFVKIVKAWQNLHEKSTS